jgi:hypothetical protein
MNVSIQASTVASALPIQRDFQVGDIIRIRGTKDVGRVIKEDCFAYTVCVFGDTNHEESFASGSLEMWVAGPARRFKWGEVRIVGTRFNGRIGYLFEDNGNEEEDMPYGVLLYGNETAPDDDEPDGYFSASELIPWVPKAGDLVTELHSGDDVGTVLANDGTTSHVQWRTLKDAPYWPNIRLEPANEMTT